jgi:TRAP-type C4-dicarboxylate transport system permease small subunit
MRNNNENSGLRDFARKMVEIGNNVEKFQLNMGLVFMVFFVAVVFIDVLFRTAGSPLIASQEIARFAYMWAVFIGSAIALRRGSHFKIDIITMRLTGKVKIFFDCIELICVSVLVVILLVPGFEFALLGLTKVSYPSGIPLIYSSICIPFNALFMIYYMVEGIISRIAGVNITEIDGNMSEEVKA